MKTKQLEPIVKEFTGKKCILRLTDGELITGIIGNIQHNILTNIYEVVLWCNNNMDMQIPLKEIEALRVV
ncbi:MAG: hypothetical protein WCG93_01400 [Paludibacter sp.]